MYRTTSGYLIILLVCSRLLNWLNLLLNCSHNMFTIFLCIRMDSITLVVVPSRNTFLSEENTYKFYFNIWLKNFKATKNNVNNFAKTLHFKWTERSVKEIKFLSHFWSLIWGKLARSIFSIITAISSKNFTNRSSTLSRLSHVTLLNISSQL